MRKLFGFIARDANPKNSHVPSIRMPVPLIDKLDAQRLREYRELLLSNETEQVANMLRAKPDEVIYVAKLLNCNNLLLRWKGLSPILKENAADVLGAASESVDISIAVPELMIALRNNNTKSFTPIIRALLNAAVNEKSRDLTVTILVNALSDADREVKRYVAFILEEAADAGVDISPAINPLVTALRDKASIVSRAAAFALVAAALNGKCGDTATAALDAALRYKNLHMKKEIIGRIREFAQKGDQETMRAVTMTINRLLNSEWFITETARNSKTFTTLSAECAMVMGLLKRLEEQNQAAFKQVPAGFIGR